MRRYGYGVTETVLLGVIQNALNARAPAQLDLLSKVGAAPLSESEREAIREILAEELLEDGFGPDDELTERGRLIEAAIDWLGHQ